MLDGTPTLRMNEFVLSSLALGRIDLEPSARPHATPLGGKVEELKWVLDEKAREDVKEAKREHEALMGDHQMAALHFTGYGSESSPSSRNLLQSRLLTKIICLKRFSCRGPHQEVQDLAGCVGAARQAPRLLQTRGQDGRLLRERSDSKVQARSNGGDSEC